MPKSITISKANSFFPEELEFKNLRTAGIQHIAELSGKLWTDHNTHDPGITILEVLCYGLTDLAYRNNLDIKDLLAQNPLEANVENNFFRPAEILTCNPLTIDDYRKLLVDTEGVRNAWLIPATDAEVDFYVSCKKENSEFTFEKTEEVEKVKEDGTIENVTIDNKPIKLNGLYKVMLELEPYLTAGESDATCDINSPSIGKTLEKVKQKLQAHRNLSEDFMEVNVLKDECVGVNSSLELEPDADPEDVLVAIYNQLTDFFQPSISFYTLQEMLDMGKSMEEIFAGRPLTYDSYGFVDMEALDALQRFEEVHASDIQREILKVPGVRAIRNLSLSSWIGVRNVRWGEEWCLPLTNADLYRPIFCPEQSDFCFFKGVMPFTIDAEEVNNRFTKRISNFSKAKKSKKDLDFTVPQGQYREDLDEYYSIQNDFPTIYQVGEKQLPIKKGNRRAQALQLKSYLLFFDQLLANYLSQLSSIRDNFSFHSNGKSTYAFQNPDMVPGVEHLLRGYDTNSNGTPNQGETLAVHPLQYETPIERDEAVRKLLAAYQGEKTRVKTKHSDCGYFYQILNGTEKVWLEGTNFYEEETSAEADANALQFIAAQSESYRLINRANDGEYSFELIYNPLAFQKFLGEINENPTTYHDRRNRFLNHLMARFGEHFTDYVLLMYAMYGKKQDPETIIHDKTEFLKSYPEISRNRGRSFNYCDPNIWNSNNITGLENKVTKLMGIPNWNRSNLNNFDIVPKGRIYFFHIKDQHGQIAFVSDRGFSNAADAQTACVDFLGKLSEPVENIANKKIQIENIDCGMDGAFGFRVLDETGCEVLANHPNTYADADFRTSRANCLIEYFEGECLNKRLVPSEGGFYFYLKNETEEVVFKSEKNYEAETMAMEDFHLFILAAKEKENYQVIKSQYSNGYYVAVGVLNTDDTFNPLARNTTIYLEEATATTAIDDLQKWILDRSPNFEYMAADSSWKWTFENQNGNVLLESVFQFKTEAHAVSNYFYVHAFALEKENYNLTEKEVDGEVQYGFELLRWIPQANNLVEQATLATHPQWYPSAAERDSVLENTLEVMSEKGWLREFLVQNSVGYAYQLLDENEKVLMQGKRFYRDRFMAGTAWGKFLALAGEKENFQIRNEAGSYEYFVELWDGSQLLATAPQIFPNEAEALACIEFIIDLAKLNPPIATEKTKKLWGFFVPEKEDEIYESAFLYSTKLEAALAFLKRAKTLEFKPLLQLKPIAGKWKLDLKNNVNELLLEGTKWMDSEQAIQLYSYDFLALAKEYVKYGRFESEDACLFGLELFEESIEVVATHPNLYETKTKRNKKINEIIQYAESHCFDFEIKSSPGKYHTEIWWENCAYRCEPLLIEIARHEEKDLALETWAAIERKIIIPTVVEETDIEDEEVENANDKELEEGDISLEIIYDGEEIGYSIYAVEEGAVQRQVAKHPSSFLTAAAAEKIKEKANQYLKNWQDVLPKHSEAASDAIFNECEIELEWKRICEEIQEKGEVLVDEVFKIEKEKNKYILKLINIAAPARNLYGIHTKPFTRLKAAEAKRDEYFKLIKEGKKNAEKEDSILKNFTLEKNDLTAEKDWEKICGEIQNIEKDKLFIDTVFQIEQTEGGEYVLQLANVVEPNKELYAVHTNSFTTELAAKEQRYEYFLLMKEGGENENGLSKEEILDAFTLEKEKDLRAFRLAKEDYRMACHTRNYETATERDDAMKAFFESLHYCLPDFCEPCLQGKVTHLINERFHFLITLKKDDSVLWQSVKGYATRSEAMESLKKQYIHIFELARKRSAYKVVTEEDETIKLHLLDEENNVVVISFETYPDQDTAKSAIRDLIDCAMRYPIFQEGQHFGFRWYDEELERFDWTSACLYKTPRAAWQDFKVFLELLRNQDNYLPTGDEFCGFSFELGEVLLQSKNIFHESIIEERLKQFLDLSQAANSLVRFVDFTAGCQLGFQYVGENYRLARHPKTFYTPTERERMRDCLFHLKTCDQIDFSRFTFGCTRKGDDHFFVIKDEDGKKLWKSYQGYSTRALANEHRKLFFHEIMTAAREPDFYQFGESEDSTAVELLHPSGQGVIAVAVHYQGNRPQVVTEEIIKERILTARKYPVIKFSENKFGFQVYAEGCEEEPATPEDDGCDFIVGLPSFYELPGEVIWENVSDFREDTDAREAVQDLLDDFLQQKTHYARVEEGCESYGLEIVNPSKVLAVHPRTYVSKNDLEKAIERTKSCLNTEGFHVVEHILLRPRTQDEELLGKVKPCVEEEICTCAYPQDERGLDGFDIFEDYIPGADPFSFWVTIVLPFWSERFQNPNFRTFFEGTLRREIPAHIALRIAWVDPQQMEKFEKAYKEWLEVLANPHHCDYTERQCELLKVLFNLKNVYPTGRLLDREQAADDAGPIVLNQTTIG